MNKSTKIAGIIAIVLYLWRTRGKGVNPGDEGTSDEGTSDQNSGGQGTGSGGAGGASNGGAEGKISIDERGFVPGTTIPNNVFRWLDLVNRITRGSYEAGIQDILAIIWQESYGDPNAVGAAGDAGLMQVIPANYVKYGLTKSEMLQPEFNISMGLVIYKECQKHVGDWFAETGKTSTPIPGPAFECYNGGPGAIGDTSGRYYEYAKAVSEKASIIGDYLYKIGYI